MYGLSPAMQIESVSVALPQYFRHNKDLKWIDTAHKTALLEHIGIHKRHIVQQHQLTDLALAAAAPLQAHCPEHFDQLGLCLVITQTSPWRIPSTAFYLHKALKLSPDCLCLELNLGCAGYVYGLWTAACLLASIPNKYALIIAGDVSSKHLSPQDSSTVPLFSDAMSATVVRLQHPPTTMPHVLANQGKECDAIALTKTNTTNQYLHMDGMRVLRLAIQHVVPSVRELLTHCQLKPIDIDYFVFHQASRLINESIRERLAIPKEKYPYSLENWGNTSSATLPMTLTTIANPLQQQTRLLFCGFGVGVAWGCMVLNNPPMRVFEPVLI